MLRPPLALSLLGNPSCRRRSKRVAQSRLPRICNAFQLEGGDMGHAMLARLVSLLGQDKYWRVGCFPVAPWSLLAALGRPLAVLVGRT